MARVRHRSSGERRARLVNVTPHPAWVADLNAALEPTQEAILNTPVIEDAAENRLVPAKIRSEEHTSELQSRPHLVCRLLLEKKKTDPFHRRTCARIRSRDWPHTHNIREVRM